MEILAVYDTTERIESHYTPDLLAQVLFEYVPKSNSWVSVPDDGNPTGKNWAPKWSDLAEASAEIERFLASNDARGMAVDGFTTDELIDELRLFCDELQSANKLTSRFHLSVY
jgi:hypothetical protein